MFFKTLHSCLGLVLISGVFASRSSLHSDKHRALSHATRLKRPDATASFSRTIRRLHVQPWSQSMIVRASYDPPPYAVRPADFGADPTGVVDSSAAFTAAVSALRARNTSGNTLEGLVDLGGCLLDLEGGDYLLSNPVTLGQGISNFAIAHGTLRAGPEFSGAFVLDIGTGESGGTGCDWCVDAFAIEDLFLDGGGVAGGLRLAGASGGTVGPDIYAVNFSTTSVGIDIEGGHEVELSGAWVGVCLFADWDCRRTPASLGNSTGVLVNGNDHVLRDIVVWAAYTGVNVLGAANVVDTVHTWNADAATIPGSAGIVVSANFNRITSPYLDGAALVLDCSPGPQGSGCEFTTVTDGFFLGLGAQVWAVIGRGGVGEAGSYLEFAPCVCMQIIFVPPAVGLPPAAVRGVIIRDNIFSAAEGNASIIVAGGADAGIRLSTVIDVSISGSSSTQSAVGTRAIVTLSPSVGPWQADFSALLLFNASQGAAPIRSVTIAAVCHAGTCGAAPYALAPNGSIVHVVPSASDSGGTWGLTLTVDQSMRSVPP
jgi:hypothetical protein